MFDQTLPSHVLRRAANTRRRLVVARLGAGATGEEHRQAGIWLVGADSPLQISRVRIAQELRLVDEEDELWGIDRAAWLARRLGGVEDFEALVADRRRQC